MFISKRKLRKFILNFINANNLKFNEALNNEATEQHVRDAMMIHSGQVGAALTILQFVGGKKNGKKKAMG